MRVLAFTTLVALAAAQIPFRLPFCAKTCVEAHWNSIGCAITNPQCACWNFQDVHLKLFPCLEKVCESQDLEPIASSVQHACGVLGYTIKNALALHAVPGGISPGLVAPSSESTLNTCPVVSQCSGSTFVSEGSPYKAFPHPKKLYYQRNADCTSTATLSGSIFSTTGLPSLSKSFTEPTGYDPSVPVLSHSTFTANKTVRSTLTLTKTLTVSRSTTITRYRSSIWNMTSSTSDCTSDETEPPTYQTPGPDIPVTYSYGSSSCAEETSDAPTTVPGHTTRTATSLVFLPPSPTSPVTVVSTTTLDDPAPPSFLPPSPTGPFSQTTFVSTTSLSNATVSYTSAPPEFTGAAASLDVPFALVWIAEIVRLL